MSTHLCMRLYVTTRKKEHGASNSNNPDLARITAINADLSGRSGGLCSSSHPDGNPESDPGPGAFCSCRFGQYDLIDFVAVLIGYVLSGEPTLLAFYERLAPWASPFMALFGRGRLPHRSTLSRFLAALDQPTVEALRIRFQEDVLARNPFSSPGGLFDRTGARWLVLDVDGTRQAARQRALPQTDALPAPHRRFDQVCAPVYQGRKRGEVVRTRTVVLQAHTQQFLGTFGGPGNGDYRGELRQAIGVIKNYATKFGLSTASVLLRLDGLYGDAAPLTDVLTAGLGVIVRSRAYHLLDLEMVKQTLASASDHVCTHPESGMTRTLYDCVSVPLTPTGPEVRLVIATHAVTSSPADVGVERDGIVYELFVSTLPSPAFPASDVLDLYLHRGSFETVLADEDVEQNADRWYSHTQCGQEFAQILAQWVWNLRLEMGQKLSPEDARTTEFAKALVVEQPLPIEPSLAVEPVPSEKKPMLQAHSEGNCWYVCLACEVESVARTPYTDEAIGIDLGVSKLATLSTGDMIENPKHYRRAEKKLAKAQQALSRKKRGLSDVRGRLSVSLRFTGRCAISAMTTFTNGHTVW
ncbi:putative transposase IS891/IS1136/IS1341 family [Ktedonobacter racemifer DSM 44963]|uniref:Putative transposase IS891/IS1136/IS1341 family n=1 Tax=Ktedonobacter racemifer DSM 44963 TaxID=485913 RepID=D6TWT2_KTERA|nr:putative transposase IS891/IS1136/IS1341 family [Ktedonobacter racemifer DSM 44963]